MIRALGWIVVLTAVFMLTLASGYLLDIVIGVLVAAGTLWFLRGWLWPAEVEHVPLSAREFGRRLLAAPAFLAVTFWDITVGTWQVSLIVLGFRPLHEPGVVVIDVSDRTEMGAVVTALAATASPGELVVHHDAERRELHMHLIDASDPGAVRERYRTHYERWQKRFVP